MAMWPFRAKKHDPRSGRVVFLIECLLNQNARDLGAAESPAMVGALVELLAAREVGMVQIPCPEIACLGFARRRAPGEGIRDALSAPSPAACCAQLAMATAERIQCYLDQGYQVLAVLDGNDEIAYEMLWSGKAYSPDEAAAVRAAKERYAGAAS
jgi:hypothetical protein